MTAGIELADSIALADLVNRYAALVDSGSYSEVADLFTEHGELVAPEPPDTLLPSKRLSGREEIVRELSRLGDFPVTVHELVGMVFDPGENPGYARGRITCVAHHLMHKGDRSTDLTWRLRYSDTYRRTTGAWRIERREIRIDVIELREVKRIRS